MKRIAKASALGVILFFIGAPAAMAVSGYLTQFLAAFPSSTSATTASWATSGARCNICHVSGGGTDLNAYGAAWMRAGLPAFTAINNDNSDGSAGTNIEEINANSQPGWRPGPNNTFFDLADGTTVTATGQSPPSTLIGNADPAATPVNRPPVLGAIGNKTVNEGQLLAFTATATDPDGNALTFSAGNLPTGATLNATTGAFSWTPTFDQAGNFTMSITVTDNGTPAASASETFTITVGNVNRPPVLGAIGNKTVNEGQSLTFTASATDPDGNALTFSGGSLPSGAVLDPASGAFNWTPTFDQAGSFTVTVTVTDNGTPAGSDSETITITVGDVNRPPVLGTIGNKTVNTGQTLTFTATATDPDGNALAFAGGSLPAGATLNPTTGAFSWTPTASQAGNFPVTITVTDNGVPAASDFEAITITVGAVNRPPVLDPIGDRTVNEGQLLSFTATATDPDGNALTFAGSNLPTGATINATTGVFSWSPTFDQAGNFPVTITVTDNGTPAASASENITITVGNVNRPPVLDPIGNKNVSEGQTLAFTATATDPDGNTLAFSGGSLPTGATLDATTGAFSWTPAAGQAGNFPVTITVTDNGTPAAIASEIITISVGNVNRPPVLATIGNQTANVGQLLTFTASASDPDGNALMFSSADLPAGATLNATSGAFSWTPTSAQLGNFTTTISVADNGTPALSASETITITVGAVNQPPVLSPSPIGNRTVVEGQTLTIAITASDPDGGVLTFTNANMPSGATLTPGANGSATFSWTPASGQAGTYSNVTITVSDGSLTDSEIFTITVQAQTAGNRKPAANAGPDQIVQKRATVTLDGSASIDPNGDPLTYRWVFVKKPDDSDAKLMNADTANPTFVADKRGRYKARLTVSDGSLRDRDTVSIRTTEQPKKRENGEDERDDD